MAPPRRKKTSKAEFNRFRLSFRVWVREFGLDKTYTYRFEHKRLDGSIAEVEKDVDAGSICVSFATVIEGENRHLYEGPEALARHEALHVLLARLIYLAGERYVTEKELDAAEHEVIVKLEGLI